MEIAGLVGAITSGLQLAHKWRQGVLAEAEAKALYSRIFSALLFEVRQNLARCAYIAKEGKQGRYSAGVLSFLVRDALFSSYCIICPEPTVIAKLNEVYAAFERIRHWQGMVTDTNSRQAQFVQAFSQELFKQNVDHVYDELLRSLRSIAPEKLELPEPWQGSSEAA